LDGIERKCVKWVLNLDRRTLSNFILLKEMKMRKLSMQAIKRAIKYKEKTCRTKKEIVKKCIRDLERNDQRKRKTDEKSRGESC